MTVLRGEFIRGDGLVIPNNITRLGCQRILDTVFNGGDLNIWMALVRGVYSPALAMTSLVEPTIGTNGYGRKELAVGLDAAWNAAVLTDDGAYVQSDPQVFAASGGAFDESVQRIALVDDISSGIAGVLALSNAAPEPLVIDESTAAPSRTFSYRIYL